MNRRTKMLVELHGLSKTEWDLVCPAVRPILRNIKRRRRALLAALNKAHERKSAASRAIIQKIFEAEPPYNLDQLRKYT